MILTSWIPCLHFALPTLSYSLCLIVSSLEEGEETSDVESCCSKTVRATDKARCWNPGAAQDQCSTHQIPWNCPIIQPPNKTLHLAQHGQSFCLQKKSMVLFSFQTAYYKSSISITNTTAAGRELLEFSPHRKIMVWVYPFQ